MHVFWIVSVSVIKRYEIIRELKIHTKWSKLITLKKKDIIGLWLKSKVRKGFIFLLYHPFFCIVIILLSSMPHSYAFDGYDNSPILNRASKKIVALTFDDGFKGQFVNAKPILDKYGFKATFFIVCNYVNSDNSTYMTWDEIKTLQAEGHDIESHTMNHKDLDKLSAVKLEYEIGNSQLCLREHGINSTIFASPFGSGQNNATVTAIISRYYGMARIGYSDTMHLNCDDPEEHIVQNSCRTFLENGSLNYVNRYSIRAFSHNTVEHILHNSMLIYHKFVNEVNSQATGHDGTVQEIPILIYHDLNYNNAESSTPVNLFEAEMRYLYDNGFSVLTLNDLGYDSFHERFEIKNFRESKPLSGYGNNPPLEGLSKVSLILRPKEHSAINNNYNSYSLSDNVQGQSSTFFRILAANNQINSSYFNIVIQSRDSDGFVDYIEIQSISMGPLEYRFVNLPMILKSGGVYEFTVLAFDDNSGIILPLCYAQSITIAL